MVNERLESEIIHFNNIIREARFKEAIKEIEIIHFHQPSCRILSEQPSEEYGKKLVFKKVCEYEKKLGLM